MTAIFPRNDNMAVMPVMNSINGNTADSNGRLFQGMMNPD